MTGVADRLSREAVIVGRVINAKGEPVTVRIVGRQCDCHWRFERCRHRSVIDLRWAMVELALRSFTAYR